MTVKISNLPAATSVGSGDVLPVVQSGTTKKIDLNSPWSINIDGGNIDGTPIGVSSASSGAFTTLDASGDVNFDSGTLFVDASTNNVGIGTTNPLSSSGGLDIASGNMTIVAGGDASSSGRTNATTKVLRFGVPHYNNSEEPAASLVVVSSSTKNTIDFGGGTSLLNAATDLIFHTAANNTTTTGTERMRIDSSGNVLVGTTTAPSSANVKQVLAKTGDCYLQIASGTTGGGLLGQSGANMLFYNYTGAVGSESYAERMRIDSSGRVGIGETSPVVKLDVRTNTNGNYACRIQNQNSSNPFGLQVFYTTAINSTGSRFFDCEDVSALRMSVRSNGGIANYQANDVNLSDERVKKDIQPLPSYWQKIKEIEIVQFKYKDQTHDDMSIGVIAQQVETVAPEFVDDDGFGKTPDDGVPLKSIYTADLYHAAIKGLQEAMHRIEKLEAELDELKGA